MATKFRANIKGFAELRNHPTLVAGMHRAASQGSAGTPFEVDIVTFPHAGRKSGPRTSVQVWARTPRARAMANRDPSTLTAVLARAQI